MSIGKLLQAGALAIVVCAPVTAATNLLVNSSFDANRNEWTDPPSSADIIATAWHRDDARGSATSGSIAVTNSNAPGSNSGSGPLHCVNVTAGARYDLGAKIEVPGSQDATGNALVALLYASGPNCTASYVGDPVYGPVFSTPGGRFTPVAMRDFVIPAGVQSVQVVLAVFKSTGTSFTAQFDDVYLAVAGGCVPSETVLCLDAGRYSVTSTFTAPGAAAANAKAIALTDDTGYQWFFTQNNVEVTVKVLNACSVNGFHWVFVSGLTNVQVLMTVKDTQMATTRTYSNGQGQTFQTQLDTSAFACP